MPRMTLPDYSAQALDHLESAFEAAKAIGAGSVRVAWAGRVDGGLAELFQLSD